MIQTIPSCIPTKAKTQQVLEQPHSLCHQPVYSTFASVYGPVLSWRYGRSLGIDPIGPISTCSFNCVYCQLGEIEYQCCDRQVFIATDYIQQDLQSFSPWDTDVITISGSGEPTLALNLGEILTMVKTLTGKPVGVLSNGSLLSDAAVQVDLAIADFVAIKLDSLDLDQLHRINRPVSEFDLLRLRASLHQFRQIYSGHLAIQTMMLSPWDTSQQVDYILLMQSLLPNEIQLNKPARPRPLERQLEARGNHSLQASDTARALRCVDMEVLYEFGNRIQSTTGIPVRYPSVLAG